MQQSILGEIFEKKSAGRSANSIAAHNCGCHQCTQSSKSDPRISAASRPTGNFFPRINPGMTSLLSEVFIESEGGAVGSKAKVPVINRKSKAYIQWVQTNLNKMLRLKLQTKGVMNSQTINAIKQFQRKSKLTPTGTVDAKTEAAMIKGGATAPPGQRTAQVPPVTGCAGEKDITTAFRKFIKDAQTMINNSKSLTSGQKSSIVNMIKTIIGPEGSVNIQTFKVFSCSKISNPLAMWGESIDAEIDIAGKILRLSDKTKGLADDFIANNDLDSLTSFFQTIAHEKRHATLGSVVQVAPSALKPTFTASDALQAQYRTEEIIVRAEEIAVGKRMNSKYTVPIAVQQLIKKHFVIVESRVNATERTRLRNIIIQQLRNRYGFKGGCDNVITLGVLSCMENARWHVCSSGSIVGKIPAGLNLCKNKDGTHQVCGIH